MAVRDHCVGVCNPVALGLIAPGEAVLDLGCGGGFDALVAAQLVGPTGWVVGIGRSPEILEEAGFLEARCVGTGAYRTSGHTQATFYTARKPPAR
jgi:SAM-dependent methyltransferase